MQLSNSQEFFDFVEKLKNEFDLVLFDSTPVLGNSDSLSLLQHCSSVIFIIKHKVTRLSDLSIALNNLRGISEVEPNVIYNFYKKESVIMAITTLILTNITINIGIQKIKNRMPSTKIEVVCYANYCRSPVFAAMLNQVNP